PGLDKAEGLGYGYEQKQVHIKLNDGASMPALTYFATMTDSTLRPLAWYKEHVVRGARENELPEAYIKVIDAVETIDDPDMERHNRELSIY
ncbi:MAG: gamma-glutamylcyclotransferase, partial [Gammaproteobacteria bacterium]